ncbi:MAG: endonuclease/exonuclease/phosphatase family protein [Polyangiaceae bacterium]|nr:endonuclease/exonuclease/phosphatase family protein [Polyangiaceae bacterium]
MPHVVSYNILADAYLRPEYFPHTPPEILDPARRRAAMIERLVSLSADVYCLQEVEEPMYRALAAALPGHERRFAQKSGKKVDGCATFWRGLSLASERTLRYADETGHVALLLTLEDAAGRRLGVANTHLKWEPLDAPPESRVALGQVRQLLGALDPGGGVEWIACGDFNATPDSGILREAALAGLRDPFEGRDAFTANSNGRAKRIDYLLHTAALTCRPLDPPTIADDTPLPSSSEPSDHLPVRGDIDWV